MVCAIMLNNCCVALVDDEDYEWLAVYRWRIHKKQAPYAVMKIKKELVFMHHLISPPPDGLEVDHKNRNGLDNRRENLRHASRSQNACNRKAWGRSRMKGVYWASWGPSGRKWRAKLTFEGRSIHLGYFDSDQDAGRAYDKAASYYFGEFALLNFPPTTTPVAG